MHNALLLDASSEFLMLLDAESLLIIEANRSAHTQLGYPPEVMIGMPIGDIECALSDMFFWDDMRASGSALEVESSFRRGDGSVFNVVKFVQRSGENGEFFSIRARPMRGPQRFETELAAMDSHLRATLEATTDAILVVDNVGTILNMNHRFSALWQLPQSLLADRNDQGIVAHMDSLLIHDAESTEEKTALSHAAGLAGDPEDDTFDVHHLKDGRVLERASHPVRDKEQIIGRVFCYRDVTERHRTQQELIAAHDSAKQASRAKGEFLAMMSHEIRTPMNGVLGIAELLADTAMNDEQTDFVRIIRSSGETLLAVINDILDYSKIEAGKMELELIEFSPIALLEEIAQLFRFRQKDGGTQLICQADGGVPAQLRGDPVRLRQILFNLIGNAFKFTEGGSITVAVSIPPTRTEPGRLSLRFSVRDTGIGIPLDRQAGVFNAFEQADAATTRRFGGTGLGLSICRRLVALMGGEIGLISAPGEGSEFWFTVSAEMPTQVAELTVQASEATQALSPAVRILVVEDNPVNRRVMQGMLKALGAINVVMAENGQEGVTAASAEHFDVILMDTQMPVMDGHEATRTLRAQGHSLPIIGVSAGAMEEERQAALDAGMNDYVHKPVSKAALRAALLQALSATG